MKPRTNLGKKTATNGAMTLFFLIEPSSFRLWPGYAHAECPTGIVRHA